MIDKPGAVLLLAATALIVVGASCLVEEAETNNCVFTTTELLDTNFGHLKAKRVFQGRYECGLLKIQTDYVYDLKRDKLRLSKATFKERMTIANHFARQHKILQVQDLRPCSVSSLSNVTLIDAEVLEKLDCQDLKAFFSGDNVPSYLNDYSAPQQSYVKRSAYRLVDDRHKLDFHLYPLKESEVRSHIDKFVRDNEQLAGSLDFTPGYQVFGHHFEFYVYSKRDGALLLSFSGRYYVAGNSTKVFNWPTDPLLTYGMNLAVFIQDMSSNSFIFDMPNFKIVTSFSPIEFDMTFSAFTQEKFPFLWVEHRMTDNLPKEMKLLDYHSTVNQTQDPSDRSKYKTNILISSQSILPRLNFKLEQVINTIDKFTGSEEMFFASTAHAIAVKANWARELYRKSIFLFHFHLEDLKRELTSINGDHFGRFDIIEEPDDDYIHFNFKFKKSSVLELAKVLLKLIGRHHDVKEEIKYVNEDL